MSSTLTIEPLYRKKKSLSHELKRIFQIKFNGCVIEKMFDNKDIPYLDGLRDAGIEDAQIVIDFIEKYDEVILHEEF